MPGWVVALLVAVVGLAAGLIGTYVRISFERGAEIRTRMLDAADDFVTAMTSAQDEVFNASLPVIGWAHAWQGSPEGKLRSDYDDKAQEAFEAGSAAWRTANERVPRIRLLFGVDSPASSAAERASDEIGEAVLRLAEVRGMADDGATLGDADEAHRVSSEVATRTHAALAEVNEFSRAARAAIIGERRWLRSRRDPVLPSSAVRDPCEAEVATDGEPPPQRKPDPA